MPPSVIVAGFLADAIGIGEAARGYAEALAAAGCDVAIHPVEVPGRAPSPTDLPDLPVVGADEPADVAVLAIHPPELVALRRSGCRLPRAARNVAIWAWEVDPLPPTWAEEQSAFDEVWVYTSFVAKRLQDGGVSIPVVSQPPPLRLGAAAAIPADQPPTVVTLADAWSSLERKNPMGAVSAFTAAVPPGSGPRLVVKVRDGAADPARWDDLQRVIADRDDIELVDGLLTRSEVLRLIAGATCLLSLHRAEGLGLPLFEALALGVPVVCTAGSGPGELLPSTAARLVRAMPAPVAKGELRYGQGGRWLEPDVDDAVQQLRAVLDDPASARADARARRGDVLERLSHATVGADLRQRIESMLNPAVSVVLHATEPWPAIRPILDAAKASSARAEVVIGAPTHDVLPAEGPCWGARVVLEPSPSPFELRRAAMRHARGDLIVITEDHCVPRHAWLDAYVDAHRGTGAAILAGPVDNGDSHALSDWANYLMGFAAWGPPLESPPPGWGPTVANVAVARAAIGRDDLDAPAGHIERSVIPRLWATCPTVVPGATVAHVQSWPLLLHAVHHFEDCRTAGAHEHQRGFRRSLHPVAIRAEARRWLALASQSAGPRPHLHELHRRAAWQLRVLALARALGLTLGNRFGAGRAATRID